MPGTDGMMPDTEMMLASMGAGQVPQGGHIRRRGKVCEFDGCAKTAIGSQYCKVRPREWCCACVGLDVGAAVGAAYRSSPPPLLTVIPYSLPAVSSPPRAFPSHA